MNVACVRLARPDDGPGLLEIYAPVVRDSATSFEYELPDAAEMGRRVERVLERHPWLVACDADDAVLGYAYAARYRERAAYDWIVETSVYVHPRAHRAGVGARLYAALLPALELQGLRRAIAGATLPNPASVAFHERFGFEACGVVHRAGWKHGAWHDVGFWELPLGDQDAEPRAPMSARELFADPRFLALLSASA